MNTYRLMILKKGEIMQNIHSLLISEIDEVRVKLNEPMSKHTSFGIGGEADVFVKLQSVSELESVIRIVKSENIDLTVIRKWY